MNQELMGLISVSNINLNSVKSGLKLCIFTTILASAPALAEFKSIPLVSRLNDEKIVIEWENTNPIDIYETTSPNSSLKDAKRVLSKAEGQKLELASLGENRSYFILVDTKDHSKLITAERALPLKTGSNFRDLGGYKAFGNKHVKWGRIFRSGATAMLSSEDVGVVKRLKIGQMVDLRSQEERVLAPSKIDGVNYASFNYSFGSMMKSKDGGTLKNGVDLYRNFPEMFAPQLKIIFSSLLEKDVPLALNCSAGQDRTGFASAMILASLGVSKKDILSDYHLSTKYRVPANEMPKIDLMVHKDNPVAQLFSKYQSDPNAAKPQPLMDANGKAFLEGALEEIEKNWGSIDKYLETEVGLSKKDIDTLRATYLE